MMAKKPASAENKVATLFVRDPANRKGALRNIGGSQSDNWNNVVANQAIHTVWLAHSDEPARVRQHSATVEALMGIAPRDELEGMIAAQLIAAHNAAMECYRRAMLAEQTFAGVRESLNQANKLSRSYAVLLEALNRHRGKGQQKVTVEHVHVHSGGQAVVGVVGTAEPDWIAKREDLNARQIAHAPQPALRSENPEREVMPIASNAERPMPDARGHLPGGSEGK